MVIAESGTVTNRTDNNAWGEIIWQSGTETRKGFIDKEKDAESGDHNFGVRQYSPENGGRFGRIDPDWEKYRAYSPYNYAENNPLRFKDPSGFGPGDASRIQPEWTDEYTGDIVGGGVGAGLGQILSNVIGLAAEVLTLNTFAEKNKETADKEKPVENKKTQEKKEQQEKKDVTEERNWKQDKQLSKKEIEKLEKNGYNAHELKAEVVGKKHVGRYDIYKDNQGYLYVKPKGGQAAGEPLNLNIKQMD